MRKTVTSLTLTVFMFPVIAVQQLGNIPLTSELYTANEVNSKLAAFSETGTVYKANALVDSSGNVIPADDLTNAVLPAVAVVAPSTNAPLGAAADARATGVALYTGYTEWVCDEVSDGWKFVKCDFNPSPDAGGGWYATVESVPASPQAMPIAIAIFFQEFNRNATVLISTNNVPSIRLSRHRVGASKTSQLENDGDGTNRFATVAQTALKLDATAAYPEWVRGVIYLTGKIVSYNGKLYKAISDTTSSSSPDMNTDNWKEATIEELIQPVDASRITNGTNIIDAAGNVFAVTNLFGDWSRPTEFHITWYGPEWKVEDDGSGYLTTLPGWYVSNSDITPNYLGNDRDATSLSLRWIPSELDETITTVFTRTRIVETNYIGKLALTNAAVKIASPSTNNTEGTAADARVTGNALYTGFTEWIASDLPNGWKLLSLEYDGSAWEVGIVGPSGSEFYGRNEGTRLDTAVSFTVYVGSDYTSDTLSFSATRHLITPTRTSQLVNDGTNGVPFITMNDIPPSVAVVAPTTNAIAGTAADAKATGTALYTGFTEWEFTGDVPSGYTVTLQYDNNKVWKLLVEGQEISTASGTRESTNLIFRVGGLGATLVATRHLVTPTKTSQLTNDSGYLTQHQQLTPVYDDNNARFSEWTGNGTLIVIYTNGVWQCWSPDMSVTDARFASSETNFYTTNFVVDVAGVLYTVTRNRIDPPFGYTLGNQTNIVLVSTNVYNSVYQKLDKVEYICPEWEAGAIYKGSATERNMYRVSYGGRIYRRFFTANEEATIPPPDDANWVDVTTSYMKTNIGCRAEGFGTVASGKYTHAEGYRTRAETDIKIGSTGAHSEGSKTEALGDASHAEGRTTKADMHAAHAEGLSTHANSQYAHAEGELTTTYGKASHAEGYGTVAGLESDSKGITTNLSAYTHTEGVNTVATGYGSHAEGTNTLTFGAYSHAEGVNTVATGYGSHAEGTNTLAFGACSHAEGGVRTAGKKRTIAYGLASHAEGEGTQTFGKGSHSEGGSTVASNSYAHAEGLETSAQGVSSHAEGNATQAIGDNSHTEGYRTIATNKGVHAEGRYVFSEHVNSFIWSGVDLTGANATNIVKYYKSNAKGSFNINPVGGTDGFYIGKTNLTQLLSSSVSVVAPSTNAAAGTAADAKATGTALYTGFTEWELSSGKKCALVDLREEYDPDGWSYYITDEDGRNYTSYQFNSKGEAQSALNLTLYGAADDIDATRHLVTPTKTSQLVNDGAPDGGGTPYATTGDLPYAMATPGEWTFSGVPDDVTVTSMEWSDGGNAWIVSVSSGQDQAGSSNYGDNGEHSFVVQFTGIEIGPYSFNITAIRASLPGHLIDRANNLVKSSDTLQMTLPPPIPNKSRDFRVRLVITAPITSPNKITFVGATTNGVQESISFEAENGTFPTLNTISTNILHFTETAPSLFYISNKTVGPVPVP